MIEHSLWSIFVINIVVNSFLSFVTLSGIILFSLFIFRIRNPRLQALCILIPFIKLIFDLSGYEFTNWALAQHVNPLLAPENSRRFTASLIFPPFHFPFCSVHFQMMDGHTFTLADLLSLTIGSQLSLILALFFIVGCCWYTSKAVHKYRKGKKWFRHMLILSERYSHSFQDKLLQVRLESKKGSLYLSNTLHAPCIYGQRDPSIFIPKALFEQLTVVEFEAIIAHEISHLEQGDLIVNSCLLWISHLFWWVPCGLVLKKLELVQEMACDRLVRTKIDKVHLADALVKASHWIHSPQLPTLARPFVARCQVVKRLQAILITSEKQESRLFKGVKYALLFVWITILFFGKFWTF